MKITKQLIESMVREELLNTIGEVEAVDPAASSVAASGMRGTLENIKRLVQSGDPSARGTVLRLLDELIAAN